jgi:hypothetical protein
LKEKYRGYVPHFKTYLQLNTQKNTLNYFFFGSHTLSKGSFGRSCCSEQLKGQQIPSNKRSKICKCETNNCQKVCVGRNFELGLLIQNKTRKGKELLDRIQSLIPFEI